MSLSYPKLADIQFVPSSAGTLYANPAATKTYIRGLILFNGNTSSELVKLYNVPDSAAVAGTAAAGNQFEEYTMIAKENLIIDFKYPVVLSDENDTLQGSATTASKVTIQILGFKDT